MTKRTQLALATALVAALAVGASGCSDAGGKGSAGGPAANPAAANEGKTLGGTPTKGGTLTVLSNQDFSHLDPARNWTMPTMDFGTRLLYRTLVTFKAEPGKAGSELVPDLATDLGTPSDGGRTWTFTLKEGVKYEDGTPVRAQDVKYNVERSFAPDLTGGPDYAAQYLAGGESYKGPLQGQHLDSIKTPDDRTIVFRLKRPVADFSATATLPTFAPVPQSKETGTRYDARPFSSGPYKIESYDRDKKLVLVRNEHWDARTDTVRKAYPDRFVVVMGLKGGQIDDRIIAGEGADASAVQYSDMRPESAPKVLPKADVKARLLAESQGCTEMLHLNNSRAPFDDPRVREAMQYAVDKEAVVTAGGGPALNEVATAYLPPALSGGRQADTLKIPPAGDPAKAKELLKAAGKEKLKVSFAVSTGDKGKAEAIQQGLARAGVEVVIDTIDPGAYYDVIGDLSTTPDMTLAGWCPDYPSGSTWIPFVFDGRTVKEKGNQGNYSQFRDEATTKRIDEINAMADAGQAERAWIALDAEIMKKSPSVPVLLERKPLLIGTNIAGAFGHPVWTGTVDYAAIGLKDPSKSRG
ncbi:ABC transporter substrate-binding protein [Streptomyces sp. NPDC060334]|uniref:ABC transporter substrate-binding protein n=1 Tax=unclassified Streptomyces TaxID=2593676 RepID=UPI0006AE7F61|nr:MULTISPECIES: ABC transporter substrate-binding protein [unclassified Streptomyces]KOU38523.1 ABC transporter substrate-binding protein [Streptomyces sp. WM4235]MCX5072846.1 ABC transporter substrate-binding protein [Streptomyces sp. NBC_00424]WUD43853.1 ABC transporter substrate-binding protein [Streptomyces sp. NBC_00513]